MSVAVEKELPKGWILVNLATMASNKKHAIVDGPFGTQLKKHEFKENGIPVIEMQNLQNDLLITSFRRFITEEKFALLQRSSVTSFDIIISKTGTLGKLGIVPKHINNAIITSRLAKMSFNQDIVDIKFIFFFLKYLSNSNYWEKIAKGTTMKILNLKNLLSPTCPLPPLNEQKRIVAKIEELFSLVDSAKETLEKTQVLLKQYRQSILKHAFEGKLIYINDNRDFSNVSDDELKIERKRIFQKENFNSKRKYSEPRECFQNYEGLFDKSWKVISLESLCSSVESGHTPLRSNSENFDPKGIPLIKIENIHNNGRVSLTKDQLRISKKNHENMSKSKVLPDDVLINIVGMPLGKIGLIPNDFSESNINQAIVVMRPLRKFLLSKTLLYLLLSPQYYQYQIKMSTGVRQSNIKKSSVGKIPIPLIPIEYQEKLILKIEENFSLIEKNEKIVDELLLQCNQIKNSILKHAFEGKLVPQDPNDEPAEILLQRIKEEKNHGK